MTLIALLSHNKKKLIIISQLFYSSIAFEFVEYKAFMAGEICIDLENRDWNLFAWFGCMDLSLCKLNANLTKSILEWYDRYCLGTFRTLFIEL